MIKTLKFIKRNVLRIILSLLFKIFSIKNKHYIIMGLRTPFSKNHSVSKDYFMHNTKYLYLKCYKEFDNFKFIYLCDNKKMIKSLKNAKFKDTYTRRSLKGLYYILRAKYWVYDNNEFDIINTELAANSICINLWHGSGGLKKIGYDANENYQKLTPIFQKVKDILTNKNVYYIVNSKYESQCRKSAFKVGNEKIQILGSPRLDVLFHDIPHSDLFMEEAFANIKSFKEQGKKLLFYTPTFRDTGKDISGWLKSEKLHSFLRANNAILVCKLHFADKNSLDFELPEEIYKMDSTSDIYPVLKYADGLISDYSSIYFDFLLLDKPIIYHVPDLEEYQEQCRGFYEPYETLTAGVKTRTEDEIISAMQDVLNGVDNYKDDRKRLRDQTFKYQDGHNCERVVEWIKSLG